MPKNKKISHISALNVCKSLPLDAPRHGTNPRDNAAGSCCCLVYPALTQDGMRDFRYIKKLDDTVIYRRMNWRIPLSCLPSIERKIKDTA